MVIFNLQVNLKQKSYDKNHYKCAIVVIIIIQLQNANCSYRDNHP